MIAVAPPPSRTLPPVTVSVLVISSDESGVKTSELTVLLSATSPVVTGPLTVKSAMTGVAGPPIF